MKRPRIVLALAVAALPALGVYLARAASDRRFWAAEVSAKRFTEPEAAALLARGLQVHRADATRLGALSITAAALALAVATREAA